VPPKSVSDWGDEAQREPNRPWTEERRRARGGCATGKKDALQTRFSTGEVSNLFILHVTDKTFAFFCLEKLELPRVLIVR